MLYPQALGGMGLGFRVEGPCGSDLYDFRVLRLLGRRLHARLEAASNAVTYPDTPR